MLSERPKLYFPFKNAFPSPGDAVEVAAGLRWMRVRLPFALNHVNLWAIQDQLDGVDGWTIVDGGVCDKETKNAWEKADKQALDGLPVLRVIITHMHPDHAGMAAWLCERGNAPLWIAPGEHELACRLIAAPASSQERSATHFKRHGLSDERMCAPK